VKDKISMHIPITIRRILIVTVIRSQRLLQPFLIKRKVQVKTSKKPRLKHTLHIPVIETTLNLTFRIIALFSQPETDQIRKIVAQT
jgi:hypothetical protein